ncbi:MULTISPECIES: dihydroxyacetone kinase family protein [unclassified Rathayibacter]|uniref:dihydroxyacetone kinase family protein n=1 Tax=unclassified Rathayibacter TaxID=2609250 RepID=UPI0006FFFE5B|nr:MULTISPECIES: dihydroxyacetone kinase family protein [unclassified Rathayibacter]KQQ00123.1 dihydroxyacetone kinase [Rathayibacter sp. Leaf294]KQS09577.1 dihydroxyacetone kinase [Rathayibacter sp. Leaf185]
MTRLWNEPADFADDMVDGFVRANGRWVRKVVGGVSRSTRSEQPEVAVVIGGGSGHYPAFAGLVGPGLAHGAAMGNLFASPSAHQVEGVIRASEQGRGVLLSYGNYAGDVLHFTAAQDVVRAEGIDCRTVTVTDDIFSAPPAEAHKRRGIAGDLTVFKVAGAAAAAGYDIDGVERVAVATNDRTRSLGVAFTGCTLPGAEEPLFTVPEGRMAVGLGIHGEPGIDEVDIPSAAELGELFVTHLLADAEIPEGVSIDGARVVPILNGLGSVKSEELFVVYSTIADLLEARGVTLVDPQVGEFCTSFDMAGVSLTLFWVDDELETLWTAPSDTPAYRTGSVDGGALVTVAASSDEVAEEELAESSEESRSAAVVLASALAAVREVIDANADELGRLDSIAGDGDHGIGMKRGARAAAEEAAAVLERGAGAQSLLARAGDAWSDRAGGTSGALWGVILNKLGGALGDDRAVTAQDVSAGATAASDAVREYGKATIGDKTMVDALVPFVNTLAERVSAGDALASAWTTAAGSARVAADATSDLMPGLGRARSHGEKSLGTPDPGAISFALIVETIAALLTDTTASTKETP